LGTVSGMKERSINQSQGILNITLLKVVRQCVIYVRFAETMSSVKHMPKRSDFRIDRCDDCLRITRLDVNGDMHTHTKSRQLTETIIKNVCSEKIPLHSHSRTLESMRRLSNNEDYISKLDELLYTRKQKGNKDRYFNPGIKKSF